jgi:hypothetical protein
MAELADYQDALEIYDSEQEREKGFQKGLEHEYPIAYLRQALSETGVSEEEFLKNSSSSIAEMLRKNEIRYRSFGMYWYHVKLFLNEQVPDPRQWWYSGGYDGRIMEITDRGSDALNMMQAILYHRKNLTNSPVQDYVLNGISRQYSLLDDDLGY